MIVVCFCFTARNAAQARRLEIDGHRELWFRHGIRADTAVPGQRSVNKPDGERRKLDCMAAVHRREGKEDAKAAKVTVRSNFALSQWGDKVAALSVKQSLSSLSLCVSSSLKSQTKTEQEQLSGSETCHEGASLSQPTGVTILMVMCPSVLCVLVTVQEGVNCSSTRRHILYFHPWVHMLNVILAVLHVCLRHFTHCISSGKTCVLVVSHPHNSQHYVEYSETVARSHRKKI